jgi:hypothetical protein
MGMRAGAPTGALYRVRILCLAGTDEKKLNREQNGSLEFSLAPNPSAILTCIFFGAIHPPQPLPLY